MTRCRRGRPAAAADRAARPHHARDRPAGHQRPAVRAGRGRRCSSCWSLLGLDGAVLPLLWADLVDGIGDPLWPAVGIVGRAAGDRSRRCTTPAPGSRSGGSGRCCGSACGWCTARSGRAGSASTPRPRWSPRAATPSGWCMLADNLIDQSISLVMIVAMTVVVRVARAGAVLRRHDGGLRPGRDAVRAAAGTRRPAHGGGPRRVRDRAGVVAVGGPHGEAGRRDRAGAGPPGPARRGPQRPAAAGDLDPGVGPVDAVDRQRPAADRAPGRCTCPATCRRRRR